MQLIKCDYIFALLEIAKFGAFDEKIQISTTELGNKLKISQQTSSQRVLKLEELGLIKKKPYGKSQLIKITNKGKKVLRKLYKELKMVVETKESKKFIDYPQKISGEVFSGIGEGAYYISLEGYKKQFVKKLGFKPYPGTLNLKLKSLKALRKRRILEHRDFPKIKIEGFKQGTRTFGDVDALRILIDKKIEGAILFIQRTHHGAPILEIISPYFLRDKLDLKDGNQVELEIIYEKNK
ncbi:MAG: DUF120 domain-containing protein [Candidatus Lokiarchaeota archaeon]|nr:DUF120 domain-containing protein [Candidatus Lokiarchaeota archaeon]